MRNTDQRVDEYIEGASPFARPIIKHLRGLIHDVCPDVHESIKWGFPAFDHHGYLCGIAAYKAHCSFTFWKGKLLKDEEGILEIVGKTGMGHLGKITSVYDLPEDRILEAYIREAAGLNEKGVQVPRQTVSVEEIDTPGFIIAALKQNPGALEVYQSFSNYNKKEYVEWITGAKTEATRARRLEQAVEWIGQGKTRNWKYQGS